MKFSKLTLAIAATLGASASFSALAMDLYVDVKTKQIYAEPGRGRELMGSFERVGEHVAAAPAPAAEIDAIKQDLELKTNEIKALEEHAKEAEGEGKIELKDGGIEFKTKDGNFKAAINGRMQVDSQSNVNQNLNNGYLGIGGPASTLPAPLNDGVALRRARLGVEGTIFKDTDYKFEYDFTRGNGTTGAGVTDAYVRYNFSKPFSVKFGAFKEPFSLEEATSNRYITFIERNMITNTFVDNLNTYKLGAGANYSAERWQVATSFQTEPVGNNGASNSSTNPNGGSNRNNGSGDTDYEINLRASGQPWMESKTKFLHVGTSGSYININNNYRSDGTFNNGGMSFANGIGNNVDRTNILNTGQLTQGKDGTKGSHQVNHLFRYGAEAALVYGPFSAQSEYIQTNVDGKGYNGNTLMGYYGYMTYFLTGESRAYKSRTGAWDRLKPNHNFDMKGGWGAWELAAGYDYIDLNDGDIYGGRASTFKLGVNWYPNPHVRFMADWVHALDINTQNTGTVSPTGKPGVPDNTSRAFNNADLDMIETRIQLDW
ncbi:MAG: porin [Methylococcales bacterium]|nr:porin [Methylococcales bacterium]